MPPSTDLTVLIARVADGDEEAFVLLHKLVRLKLLQAIRPVCADGRLADEVLQEAFIKIWRGARLYDPGVAAPITWMTAVARNAAIDARRRLARRRPDDATMAEVDETPDLALSPLGRIGLEDLGRCLQCLPPEQRRCVLLAYGAGHSREELAKEFDRPVGTIKTWLRRAAATLKRCLEDGPEA